MNNRLNLLLRLAIPALAVAGLAFALVIATRSSRPAAIAEIVAQPAQAPYDSYIAGAGLIEAASRNVELATPVSGVVEQIFIKVGDKVQAGQPLFRIEGADAEADLRVKDTAVASAQAKVREAEVTLEDYRQQLRNVERLDTRAVSGEETAKRRANVAIYTARLNQATADLENANAQRDSARVAIERRIVRAPLAGDVLQVNVRKGEFAAAAVNATPLVLLGETSRFAVRVDIDENDAWRMKAGAEARAAIRGNSDLATDLQFAYIEPYVKPKTSLTGSSTERVDTRVLQVVYTFDRNNMPAYIGQQVDVFVKAPPLASSTGARP
ncbi:efflux RND transporter periplasmic adaptor subunit [Reyranella sp.]|uniref:efflux RND transporter periplasmic adaptor subunit n=1 Tax=Reyranella sp. TaxID=1929291 RepID=UPI003BAB8DEF